MLSKKMHWPKAITLFSVCVLLSFFFATCKEPNRGTGPTTTGNLAADSLNRGLKFYCVRLDSADIQRLFRKGAPKLPGGSADRILLQLYTANSQTNDSLGLIAYAAKGYDTVDTTNNVVLHVVDSCYRSVAGELILGNNYVSLKKLNLQDTTLGIPADIKYITFTPTKANDKGNYLIYDVEVTRSSGEKLLYPKTSDPCPPYCPLY